MNKKIYIYIKGILTGQADLGGFGPLQDYLVLISYSYVRKKLVNQTTPLGCSPIEG